MGSNFISNLESCKGFIDQNSYFLGFVYYSHIPAIIIALLFGIFVFIKSKNLPGRLLFMASIFFSLWSILDMIIWVSVDSRKIMFIWSIVNLMEIFASSATLYFSYVFLEKKDVPFKFVAFIGSLLLIFMALIPTSLNLPGFDGPNCEATQGKLIYYFYVLEILFFLWLFIYLIKKIITAKKENRKMTIYFSIGAICFLASFSGANIVASITEKWEILQYGLFGMPIFMAFLVYLVIEYGIFNIKLLKAQALIIALIILTGSQLLFVRNPINQALTIVTLIFVSTFGWWLAISVKKEDEQNDSLRELNKIIAKQKNKIERDKKAVEAANEELVKLDKAKTEFINIASHQLKTPISVIQGVASMMIEGDMDKMLPEQRQTFYKSVWQKTKKLKTIVHDILNATSFNDQKYSIMDKSAEMINIPKLLQQTIDDFEMETKERGIELILIAKENIPEVKGQKEYLEEAFINLINNAIKYTPSAVMTHEVRGKREEGAEKAVVAVSVEKDPKNPRNVLVKVEDNGIGIPKEAKAKLFKRFSRAQNAVDMYTDGTGLGLFIVKEIVEGHCGKVWFESEVNKGTTFFVSLPFVPKETVNIKEHITQESTSNSVV